MIIDIIQKKKNGLELTEEEISFVINGYVKGEIPDYQISALLMAIYFNSMTDIETVHLTHAMVSSGDRVDLSSIDGIKVDKHSTGGVADTTTLILAPLVASLGAPVCKMSGRGLGHTGGTLDKLESIENFNVEQSIDDFISIVNDIGISIIGQSMNLAPADKLLYSLRDVTATVDSIPLIASSIMSKKIAAGANALMLDVKVGNGAFIEDIEEATMLANAMVSLGKAAEMDTRAMLSDMNQPLGKAVGNSLEVIEAIDVLKGSEESGRLKEVALTLGANMLEMAGVADLDKAYSMLNENISNGKGLDKLKEMVTAHGGNPEMIDNPNLLPKAKNTMLLKSKVSGYINSMDTKALGRAACILGAGREQKTDIIDHAVGYIMECELGDRVEIGSTLCEIHYNDDTKLTDACDIILNSVIIDKMSIYKKQESPIINIIKN